MFFLYYGGLKIVEMFNQIGFDVMMLGNYEFDCGDDYLGEFFDNLIFFIVSVNIKFDYVVLNKIIKFFYYFEQYELVVIGVMIEIMLGIVNFGLGMMFEDFVKSVQEMIDYLRGELGVKRIVVLIYIGYEEDQRFV